MKEIDFHQYSEFMNSWPKELALPDKIVLIQEDWDMTHAHMPEGFFDPIDYDCGDGPEIVLMMTDGEELSLTEIDSTDVNPEEVEWVGDWSTYSQESRDNIYDALNQLFSVVAPNRILFSTADLPSDF